MEASAGDQLSGLVLGNILSELGVLDGDERDEQMERLGIAQRSKDLDRDAIFNERYEDEDEDLGAMEVDGEGDGDAEQRAAALRQQEQNERYYRAGLAQLASSSRSMVLPGTTQIKVEEEESLSLLSNAPPSPSNRKKVEEIWPGFRRNEILNFTDMFQGYAVGAQPQKRQRIGAKVQVRPALPYEQLPVVPSSRELEKCRQRFTLRPSLIKQLLIELEHAEGTAKDALRKRLEAQLEALSQGDLNMDLEEWEKRVILNDSALVNALSVAVSHPIRVDRPPNEHLASASWEGGIIWSSGAPFKPFANLILDMNDPDMMLEVHNDGDEGNIVNALRHKGNKPLDRAAIVPSGPATSARSVRARAEVDPFNFSNDDHYEVPREQRHRVRQTLGALVVQHAWPAIKMQLPAYKTRLTKAEARSFHRPAMQFPSNLPLTFSRLVKSTVKTSKDEHGRPRKLRNAEEVLHSTRDLTLKDTGPFVLYEFSEEYPFIMSKLGMGSLIVNYYRKKDAKDEHIPKSEFGEPFVLDVNDESPFMKFGTIPPGATQPTLYNNLVRAPLFKHKPESSDFLLIRSTTKKDIRYYLREIKNLYVVGQTYPVQPIPGPHARLVTNAVKHRLWMIVNKLIFGSKGERIKIYRVMRYFSDQSELQMRVRLKELLEYRRAPGDPDQGYWKVRPNHSLPDMGYLREQLPPEHIALCEAMQAGQRRLLDAGYTRTADGADDEGDETAGKLDIEQLLAPWTATKNFLNASQGKAMLQLHGEGDPSGRGEAFSFLRVSMKETFLRAGEADDDKAAAERAALKASGHRYNIAAQQATYRSEIERIWNAQHAALSSSTPPRLTWEDEERFKARATPEPEPVPASMRAASLQRSERAASMMSTGSGAGTDGGDRTQESGKVMRIRRLINGKWQSEIVRDAGVMSAYIRHRQKVEDEMIAPDDLEPTGDAAVDAARAQRLKEVIARSEKNRDRRLQRNQAKTLTEGGTAATPFRTDTKRRCGRCGEVGHMATNMACPQYPRDSQGVRRPSAGPAAGSHQRAMQSGIGAGGGNGIVPPPPSPGFAQFGPGAPVGPFGSPITPGPSSSVAGLGVRGGGSGAGGAGSPPAGVTSADSNTGGGTKLKIRLKK